MEQGVDAYKQNTHFKRLRKRSLFFHAKLQFRFWRKRFSPNPKRRGNIFAKNDHQMQKKKYENEQE